jgi:hypothetical protein
LPAQQRVVGVGDVPGGADVVVGGEQVPVDEDAVVDVEPAGPRQFDVRGDADADDDHVGVQRGAVGQHNPAGGRRVGAGGPDRGDGDAAAQVDAVVGVQVGEHLRHLGPEHPQQRKLAAFEHGHLAACGTSRCGGLQPDPTPVGTSQAATACTARPRAAASRIAQHRAASEPGDPSTPTTIPPLGVRGPAPVGIAISLLSLQPRAGRQARRPRWCRRAGWP